MRRIGIGELCLWLGRPRVVPGWARPLASVGLRDRIGMGLAFALRVLHLSLLLYIHGEKEMPSQRGQKKKCRAAMQGLPITITDSRYSK